MKIKIITVLRYIFSIPLAFILSRLIYIGYRFIGNFTGFISSRWTGAYGPSSFDLFVFDLVICPAVYVYLTHQIAPAHKKEFVIVAITLYTIYSIVALIATFLWSDVESKIWLTIGSVACVVAMVITGIISVKNESKPLS